MSRWLLLVMLLATGQGYADDGDSPDEGELRELPYPQAAVLDAKAHVAVHQDTQLRGVYLAIHNHFRNTVTCGGQFLALVEKDGEEANLLLRFVSLQVLPTAAFPYQLVHLISDGNELPAGYVFVAKEYPVVEISCRGADTFEEMLPPELCQKGTQHREDLCQANKVRYPYTIGEFRLGSCAC